MITVNILIFILGRARTTYAAKKARVGVKNVGISLDDTDILTILPPVDEDHYAKELWFLRL
jgi:hypothetical protein